MWQAVTAVVGAWQVCLRAECGFVPAPRRSPQWYTFAKDSKTFVLHPSLRGGAAHVRFLSSVQCFLITLLDSLLCLVFVICVTALEISMMLSMMLLMMLSMMLPTKVDLGWAPHQVRMFKFEAPQGAGGEMLKPLQAFAMKSCQGNCVFDRPTCQV